MTKKDFFRVLIKVFGLYSIIISLSVVPQTLMMSVYNTDAESLYIYIISFSVFVAYLYLLLFKTDIIINLLKLDKGFDDDKVFFKDLTTLSIIKLSLIIIGLLLIVNYLPHFLLTIYSSFKQAISKSNGLGNSLDFMSGNYFDILSTVLSIMSMILGFIIITNVNPISKWLDKSGKAVI